MKDETKDKIVHLTNILNDNIFKIINDNEQYKRELKDLKSALYEVLLKLDKIKLLTSDKEIIKIIDRKENDNKCLD